MPFRFEVETQLRGGFGRIPMLGNKLSKRMLEDVFERAEEVFQERHDENTAPGSGRLIKNPDVNRAVNLQTRIEKKGKGLSGIIEVEISGSKTVQGIVVQNELGTIGAGGTLSPIQPKRSRVLTVPNTRSGVGGRAKARDSLTRSGFHAAETRLAPCWFN